MAFGKKIYVAKYVGVETNSNGIETPIFDMPQAFYLNHQPISGEMAYKEYGVEKNAVRRAFGKLLYVGGKIKEQDKVYLIDGDNYGENIDDLIKNEDKYCRNANYEVVSVLPSNFYMKIDFKKIK